MALMIPCPFVGRIHFTWHLKGFASMGFIIFYWFYNTQMISWIVLWPGYNDNKISLGFIIFYWTIAVNCFICIFKASFTHPGRIPAPSSSSDTNSGAWTYCDKCCIKRPPRAHHCRRCQHCVRRMDHHCPWINNCVGADNHHSFVLLLIWAMLLSIFSMLVAILHIFVYSPCINCDEKYFLNEHSTTIMVSVIICGILMGTIMGMMWFIQHFNWMTDRTTLQNIIEPPSIEAEWVDKPRSKIYEDYCGPGPWYRWIWPCFRKPNNVYFEEAQPRRISTV